MEEKNLKWYGLPELEVLAGSATCDSASANFCLTNVVLISKCFEWNTPCSKQLIVLISYTFLVNDSIVNGSVFAWQRNFFDSIWKIVT